MLGFANTDTSSSISLTPQLLPSVQTMQQQELLHAIELEQQDQKQERQEQQEQQEQPVTGENSRATTNSTFTESDDLISPDAFGGVEPQFILSALFRIGPEYCLNGKTFWATYDKSWDKLTALQKNKTLQFYNKNLINDAARHHLRDMARAQIVESVTEQRSRQEITSKHDKARLFHLRKDPAATVMWTRALRPLTRTRHYKVSFTQKGVNQGQ
jgi:type II secretory pathway pseudopilin PulG